MSSVLDDKRKKVTNQPATTTTTEQPTDNSQGGEYVKWKGKLYRKEAGGGYVGEDEKRYQKVNFDEIPNNHEAARAAGYPIFRNSDGGIIGALEGAEAKNIGNYYTDIKGEWYEVVNNPLAKAKGRTFDIPQPTAAVKEETPAPTAVATEAVSQKEETPAAQARTPTPAAQPVTETKSETTEQTPAAQSRYDKAIAYINEASKSPSRRERRDIRKMEKAAKKLIEDGKIREPIAFERDLDEVEVVADKNPTQQTPAQTKPTMPWVMPDQSATRSAQETAQGDMANPDVMQGLFNNINTTQTGHAAARRTSDIQERMRRDKERYFHERLVNDIRRIAKERGTPDEYWRTTTQTLAGENVKARENRDNTTANTAPVTPAKETSTPAEQAPAAQAPAAQPAVTTQQETAKDEVPAQPASTAQQTASEETPEQMTYTELLKRFYPVMTPEEKAEQQRRQRNRQIINAVGDGISALANLYYTNKSGVNAYDPSTSLTKAAKERYDKLLAQQREDENRYKELAYRSGVADLEMAYKRQRDAKADELADREAEYKRKRDEVEDGYKKSKEDREIAESNARIKKDEAMANYYNNGGKKSGTSGSSTGSTGSKDSVTLINDDGTTTTYRKADSVDYISAAYAALPNEYKIQAKDQFGRLLFDKNGNPIYDDNVNQHQQLNAIARYNARKRPTAKASSKKNGGNKTSGKTIADEDDYSQYAVGGDDYSQYIVE